MGVSMKRSTPEHATIASRFASTSFFFLPMMEPFRTMLSRAVVTTEYADAFPLADLEGNVAQRPEDFLRRSAAEGRAQKMHELIAQLGLVLQCSELITLGEFFDGDGLSHGSGVPGSDDVREDPFRASEMEAANEQHQQRQRPGA